MVATMDYLVKTWDFRKADKKVGMMEVMTDDKRAASKAVYLAVWLVVK